MLLIMLPVVNLYPLFLQIICKNSLRQPLSEADVFLFVLQTVINRYIDLLQSALVFGWLGGHWHYAYIGIFTV